MEEKNNKIFEQSEKQNDAQNILVESIAPDMVPVPIERYTELIKKEVELDLIYARRRVNKSFSFDEFLDALMAVRFGNAEEE